MTPYRRILRAARRGIGVRLSPEEAREMAKDQAIRLLAKREEAGDAKTKAERRAKETTLMEQQAEYDREKRRQLAYCSCGHQRCEHDAKGRCLRIVFETGKSFKSAQQCGCRRFDGQE